MEADPAPQQGWTPLTGMQGRSTQAKGHFTEKDKDSRGVGRGVPGGFLEEEEWSQHAPSCSNARGHKAVRKTNAAECGMRHTEAERLLHGVTRARGGRWPSAPKLWAGQGKGGQGSSQEQKEARKGWAESRGQEEGRWRPREARVGRARCKRG